MAEPDYPFWGFGEVLAIGALLPIAFFVGLLVISSAGKTMRFTLSQGITSVLAEMIGYGILFAILWFMFQFQGRPLLASLAWVRFPFSTLSLAGIGVALAIAVVVLTVMLRTPNVETPLQKLLSDRATRLLVGIFGVTAGPVAEELLFRGFLQPVLMRVTGVFPGILLTAVLFGSVHAQQYAAQWQLVLGVTLVGFVLGVVKHLSGSTVASSIVHIAYNSVFFLAMLAAGEQNTPK